MADGSWPPDMTTTEGPALFPRVVIDRDEKGFPCLAHDCPFCGATALIVNEWDAVECLTCSWREFGPDSPRAADASPVCPECNDTGIVWTDICACGRPDGGTSLPHENPDCGTGPCPNGCPVVMADGSWPPEYPPADQQAIIDGCTCPGRREGRHDLCCERVLRGAGLVPADEANAAAASAKAPPAGALPWARDPLEGP